MFESIGRSIALVRTSWGILMQEKRLLAFPVLSGLISLIVLATFVAPLFLTGMLSGAEIQGGNITLYGTLFLFYLVSYCVVIFFNTALITCVNARLNGRQMGVGEALSAATRHLPAILAWALISATVGLLLQILRDRAGFIGEIAAALIGGAWGLVTFFVIPIFVIENKGVFDAMKESAALIRKTWGESIIGAGSILLVFFLIGLAAFGLTMATILLDNSILFLAALLLFVIVAILLAVVASAMQGIFVTALYTYAKSGTVPQAFDRDLIADAFVTKPGTMRGNI